MSATAETLLYFAYGSNLSTPRLRARTPSARPVAPARLDRHRLVFRKRGTDGSAKADIERTDRAHDRVHGVVFRLDRSERGRLDAAEGLGNGYELEEIEVVPAGRRSLRAITYRATDLAEDLAPFDWYLEHVLAGARMHGLDPDHVRRLERVSTRVDPDPRRAARERAVYD